MPNAQVALANITLSSAAATVTFGSIPATYRDLKLVITLATGTGGQYLDFRINSDSASNYTNVTAYGNGTSAASYSGSGTWINLAGQLNMSSVFQYSIDIMDYSATDKHKAILIRTGNTGDNVSMQASRWASTAAVTTLNFFPETGGVFAAGSTFALYGVIA